MVVVGKNSEKKKNCSKKEQKKNIVKKKTCHLEYVSRPGENGRFEEYHRENHLIREKSPAYEIKKILNWETEHRKIGTYKTRVFLRNC